MARSLTAFFAQNAAKVEVQKAVVSTRFVDDEGKPLEWEYGSISAADNAKLRSDCVVSKPVPGKPGKFTSEVDGNLYTIKLCAASTVFPDLRDAVLQDSYHVHSEEDLLGVMLTSGELDAYAAKVFKTNRFAEVTADLLEEAKN